MRLLAGTSGFSFPEWKGTFYPADLPSKQMLPYFAARLPTVEVNNTFYRMPKAAVLAAWAEQVPASFRFTLKAPQRISHWKRLVEAGEETRWFLAQAATLGERLGSILIQLPPNLKLDLARLEGFLPLLASSPAPVAFEFRHPSWDDPAVDQALTAAGCARCASEVDGGETDGGEVALAPGAPFGYLRLRRSDYDETALGRWVARLRDRRWPIAFVYFKHEEQGRGPALAQRFLELWAAGEEPAVSGTASETPAPGGGG